MKRRDRGFTLIEVVIASAILVGLVGMIFLVLHTSSTDYEVQSIMLRLDERGREVLNQISKDLRMSSTGTLATGSPSAPVPPGQGYYSPPQTPKHAKEDPIHDLQFSIPGAFSLSTYKSNPSSLLNTPIRYRWVMDPDETDDGQDNDNDGLADEGFVEKLDANGQTTKICDDVQENGLQFRVADNLGNGQGPEYAGSVEVTLILEVVDPKSREKVHSTGNVQTIVKAVTTTVDLRN